MFHDLTFSGGFWVFYLCVCVVDWLVGWIDFSENYLVWLIWDNVSHSSDCLQTQCVEEVGLELLILLPLPTGCWDLQVCAIMSRSVQVLVSCVIIVNIFSWLKSLPEWPKTATTEGLKEDRMNYYFFLCSKVQVTKPFWNVAESVWWDPDLLCLLLLLWQRVYTTEPGFKHSKFWRGKFCVTIHKFPWCILFIFRLVRFC